MPPTHNAPFFNSSHLIVIIGEADPFLARLLQRFAEKCGFRTLHAQTGETLLELIVQVHPALVILDPELPGKLRGWETYQQIRTNNQLCATPVILCTWLNKDEAQGLVGKPAPYLKKPDLHFEDFVGLLDAAGVRILSEDT